MNATYPTRNLTHTRLKILLYIIYIYVRIVDENIILVIKYCSDNKFQNEFSKGLYLDNLGYGDVQQELRQAASVELFMFPCMFWFFGFFILQIYVYKNLAIIWAKAQMFRQSGCIWAYELHIVYMLC